MTPQFDLFAAQQAARDGAQRAADNADATTLTNWTAQAGELVREYAMRFPYFMAEDVRAWAHGQHGLPLPPDGRAWGAVMQNAARAAWVERAGISSTRSTDYHASPKTLWASRLFKHTSHLVKETTP